MMKETTVIYKPNSLQFIAEEWKSILLTIISIFVAGIDLNLAMLIGIIGTAIMAIHLFGRYLFITSIKWTISDSSIEYERGILRKTTDYMELYRIVDMKVQETFLERIFGLKSVYIISGDRTNPILRIFGIPKKDNIIEMLRRRIKTTKNENHIYEITNR